MPSTTSSLPDVDSPEVARAGINAFFGIADRWALKRTEMAALLGVRSTSTLDNWRKKPPQSLPVDTLERISYLMHIFRSLQQIFPPDRADQWLRRSNSAVPFLGQSALEFMLQGRVQHLLDVHRHLKGVASGGF